MSVLFLYPYEAPQTSIRLPNPVFGDTDNINLQVTVRHSRNGDRYAYKRTPTYETQHLEFHGIPYSDRLRAGNLYLSGRESIKTFLINTAATTILLIDHRSRRWKGVILNNPEFAAFGSDGCSDLFSLSIDFEGERY